MVVRQVKESHGRPFNELLVRNECVSPSGLQRMPNLIYPSGGLLSILTAAPRPMSILKQTSS